MVELLRTYSDENASEVKDDARNCVVSLLGRPNVLIMDFLLALPPVAALQGEPIYQVHVHRVRTGHGKPLQKVTKFKNFKEAMQFQISFSRPGK